MALRLVLVSLVAGLGVTPTAECRLAAWTCSAQAWVESQLAEWDAWQTMDGAGFPIVADATTAAPSFEAMEEELLAELAESLFENEPTRVEESPVAEDRAFEGVVDEVVAGFLEDELARALQAQETAATTTDAAVAADRETADALPEEIGRAEAGVETAMPAPQYEPMDVGEDLYPGLAFALNREAEGIPEPATTGVDAPDGGVTAGSQTRLNNAVRLTRDAVFAWMNLLQSPAIVTIPH